MGALFSFSLYSAIILALLYLCYKWVLAGENQHRFNRISLWLIYTAALTALPIATLASGLLAGTPSMEMAPAIPMVEIEEIPMAFDTAVDTEFVETRQPLYLTIILAIYLTGIVLVTLHTLWIGIRLYRVIRQGEKREIGGHTLVIIENSGIAPFSWCRYVVMSRRDWDESGQMILIHELQHLHLCHWIDLLLAQAVGILQWYNPAAWLMREELKTVHEYQADNAVLNAGVNAKDYQMLLIKKAVGARFPSLANSLNHSKLKKRITMMYNSKTSRVRLLRGLALVPACAVALFITDLPAVAGLLSDTSSAYIIPEPESEAEDTAADNSVAIGYKNSEKNSIEQSTEPESENSKDNPGGIIVVDDKPEILNPVITEAPDGKVFDVVEKKPQYPGGETALMKYVIEHIKYPESALAAGVQGRVIVQFVIKSDGSIGEVKVLRGKNEALDKEAVRVIKSLPKFTPGMMGDKPVNVWYTLPIMFRVPSMPSEKQDVKQETASASSPSIENSTPETEAAPISDDNRVFDVVEKKPQFPGGEVALLKYISSHIRYPQAAKEANLQGRVVAQFVVKKDGSIGDVRIIRGKDKDLDIEAIRVIKSLPKFIPGSMKGQSVNVWYTLPIAFKLPEEAPAQEAPSETKSDDIASYYINGIESTKDDVYAINPNDIASITVEKGTSVNIFMTKK